MTKSRQAARLRQDQSFKGRQFNAEVILWAMRCYLMFPISGLEPMLLDRGVARGPQHHLPPDPGYAAELEKRALPAEFIARLFNMAAGNVLSSFRI